MAEAREQRAVTIAGVAAGVALAYGVAAILAGLSGQSRATLGVGWLAVVAGAVALLTLLHARCRERAEEEQREAALLATRHDATLFNAPGEGQAARARRQFERYFVPGFTVVLGLAEGVIGYWLMQSAATALPPFPGRAALLGGVLAVGGLLCYLLGTYVAGLAFGGRQGLLRAIAGELPGVAVVSALGVVAAVLVASNLPRPESLLARLIALVLLVRALEKLLGVVLEVYRPRRGPADEHLLYESRLNGLLAQPRGLLGNLAETLNYQFGFRLTEASSQRLLLVWLPLFLLSQVAVFGVFSCLVVINPGEQAVRERWGRPQPAADPVLNPGVHLKLPWPVERVYRVRVSEVRELRLGVEPAPEERTRAGLWGSHAAEPRQLQVVAGGAGETATAGPGFSLVAANAVVFYRVRDLRAFAWHAAAPETLLAALARREVTRFLAAQDLTALLGPGRGSAAAGLRDRIQAAADARQLGLELLTVTLTALQPPATVAPAFQDYLAAAEEARRERAAAQAAADNTLSTAAAEAATVLSRAAADKVANTELSQARQENFLRLKTAFHEHRELFTVYAYLDTLERSLANQRKFVLATDVNDQLLNLDLKPRITGLLEGGTGE